METTVANNANERFFTGVFVVVFFEVNNIGETFATSVAFIRELLQVHAVYVRQQRRASLRSVTTQRTPENLLVAVLVQMNRVRINTTKSLIALFAFKSFIVVFDVLFNFLQGGAFCVASVATVELHTVVVGVAGFCDVVFGVARMVLLAVLF